MIEKFAHKLAIYVIEKGNKEKEDYDIYQHGFIVGIELMINVMVGMFIAALFKSIPEFIIFLAILVPLRAFAGGVHLGSFFKCFFVSTGVTMLVIRVAHYWQLELIYSDLGIIFFFV